MKTEAFVIRFITSLGLSINKISESDRKGPDFLIKDGTHSYLMELKEKFPNPVKIQQRNDQLSEGQIYQEEESTGYNNTISGVISDAVTQLCSFNREGVNFKLVWLQAKGRHTDLQLKQFKATLYGLVDVIDLGSPDGQGRTSSRPCYYFSFSEFYRHRYILDGAIISTNDEGLFCLNQMSPKYRDLKSSTLTNTFRPGVCDPELHESEGRAYLANCDVDRRDKGGVLKYIQDKYKRPRLINMVMKHFSAEIELPKE